MLKHALVFLLFPLTLPAQLLRASEGWKNDKDLKSASIGYCVQDAKTSAIIAEYNSGQGLIPASTLKVVTTTAALGLLGAGYRYETRLAYNGKFDAKTGILNGDLIIVGSGDPTLQSENFYKDATAVVDSWAKVLADKGLLRITGKIIADAACFEHKVPDGWIWSDIGNYFGTTPCGLSYQDNKFKIVYNSKAAGSLAEVSSISLSYLTRTLTVTSSVIAKGSEDEACVYGDPYAFTKEVSGSIPPNKNKFEIEAATPDPALLCAEQLQAALFKKGIYTRTGPVPVEAHYTRDSTTLITGTFYTHYSPTLDKIIFYTNMKSNNLYCESLLRTLGKGNPAAGLEAVKNYWTKRGLPTEDLFMADGSGLSRANTATTAFIASLLSKQYRDSVNYKPFFNSLPVAGKDASMSNIGKNTRIENNMHAKTGYISRARGYCGYVRTHSGKDLSFSVLFNNYNCSAKEAKLKLEKFLVELAEL